VYESIVAAIYLDGGFDVVKAYVLRTMTPKIEAIASNAHQQNYKAVLQQHAQKVMGARRCTSCSTRRARTTASASRSA
jgi:ribonuclease-3